MQGPPCRDPQLWGHLGHIPSPLYLALATDSCFQPLPQMLKVRKAAWDCPAMPEGAVAPALPAPRPRARRASPPQPARSVPGCVCTDLSPRICSCPTSPFGQIGLFQEQHSPPKANKELEPLLLPVPPEPERGWRVAAFGGLGSALVAAEPPRCHRAVPGELGGVWGCSVPRELRGGTAPATRGHKALQPCHRVTVPPCHPAGVSPCRLQPCDLVTMSPCHPAGLLPCHPTAL